MTELGVVRRKVTRAERGAVSKVDFSINGVELQDREFFAAIREGRETNASVEQVLPCYEALGALEKQLAAGRGLDGPLHRAGAVPSPVASR